MVSNFQKRWQQWGITEIVALHVSLVKSLQPLAHFPEQESPCTAHY